MSLHNNILIIWLLNHEIFDSPVGQSLVRPNLHSGSPRLKERGPFQWIRNAALHCITMMYSNMYSTGSLGWQLWSKSQRDYGCNLDTCNEKNLSISNVSNLQNPTWSKDDRSLRAGNFLKFGCHNINLPARSEVHWSVAGQTSVPGEISTPKQSIAYLPTLTQTMTQLL